MKIDRQQIILFINKYLAYGINFVIMATIAGVVGVFIFGLYKAATE